MLRWLRVNFHFLRFSHIPFHFDFWTEQHRVRRKFSITHELCVCLHSNRNECTKKKPTKTTKNYFRESYGKKQREKSKRKKRVGGEGVIFMMLVTLRAEGQMNSYGEWKKMLVFERGVHSTCVYRIESNWIEYIIMYARRGVSEWDSLLFACCCCCCCFLPCCSTHEKYEWIGGFIGGIVLYCYF